MSEAATKKHLPRQIAGAAIWSAFFILAPFFELVVFGAIVWLPLFIWRERTRTARYGFMPGAAWRFGIIAAVIAVAALAPTKHEDQRVGPLPDSSLTLGQLAAAEVIYPPHDAQYSSLRVSLPSTAPTRREVMRAIDSQTGLRAWIFHCGNAATVLFGSGGGRIHVSEEPNRTSPNHALQACG